MFVVVRMCNDEEFHGNALFVPNMGHKQVSLLCQSIGNVVNIY